MSSALNLKAGSSRTSREVINEHQAVIFGEVVTLSRQYRTFVAQIEAKRVHVGGCQILSEQCNQLPENVAFGSLKAYLKVILPW
jgi:hypothetical protein